jgi:hypothetical protein
VQFLDGSALLGSDTSSPHTLSVTLAAGAHTLVARAVDASGVTAGSAAVSVFVRKAATPALHVSGSRLVDAAGNPVVLHGVNRSGAEFPCVHGFGVFDGPMDAASLLAIASWNVNAVRVHLNSDGVSSGNSSACADATATCQKPMPDSAHAVDFWRSVAATFAGDPGTVFDLFNEPFPDRATSNLTQAWTCWRDGSCPSRRRAAPCPGRRRCGPRRIGRAPASGQVPALSAPGVHAWRGARAGRSAAGLIVCRQPSRSVG